MNRLNSGDHSCSKAAWDGQSIEVRFLNDSTIHGIQRITHLLPFPVRGDFGRVFVSWHDIQLASFNLEPLAEGAVTDVVEHWTDYGQRLLKVLSQDGQEMIFELVFVFMAEKSIYGIIRLPKTWPSCDEEGVGTIVRIVGPTHLCTIGSDTVKRLCGYLDSGESTGLYAIAKCEEVFGPFPPRTSTDVQMDKVRRKIAEETNCIHCEKPVGFEDNICPHCKANRTAPACPKCNQPVTDVRDAMQIFPDERGHYPWHCQWNYRCLHCNFEFATTIALATGHQTFFSRDENQQDWAEEMKKENPWAGGSLIEISAGDSLNLNFDCWDLQPTVRVHVSRLSSANRESSQFDLAKNETIVMTVHEWKAVIEQLSGPLSILLERSGWNRDTT